MINIVPNRARRQSPAARIIQQPRLNLLTIVEGACKSYRVSPSRFGRDAVNDPALVRDMRAGRRPRATTRAAIIAHVNRLAGSAVRNG